MHWTIHKIRSKSETVTTATSDGTRYLHGLGLAAVEHAGAWYYPHTDALGSIRRWSDASGQVVGAREYDPYGAIIQQQGVNPTPLGFAGEWHDSATGLQYLRARWYQPETGRFTQVDPFPGVLPLPATQPVSARPVSVRTQQSAAVYGSEWGICARSNIARHSSGLCNQCYVTIAKRNNSR